MLATKQILRALKFLKIVPSTKRDTPKIMKTKWFSVFIDIVELFSFFFLSLHCGALNILAEIPHEFTIRVFLVSLIGTLSFAVFDRKEFLERATKRAERGHY